jgi:hypothetical protein
VENRISQCEGLLAIQTKRINKSYSKGTPIKIVIEDFARQMGLPLANAVESFRELSETLSKNFAASGNPMKDVCRMLKGKQFNISVQNRSLQLRKKNESLQREAISLSANTGLTATPEIGTKGEFVVRSLLMPDFSPGRKVHINSEGINAIATIEAVRFTGSNFGPDWEAELKCRA